MLFINIATILATLNIQTTRDSNGREIIPDVVMVEDAVVL